MKIDIKDLAKTVAESLNLKDFKGDVVALKVVENEIGTIEEGGIGIQNVYNTQASNTDVTPKQKEDKTAEKESAPIISAPLTNARQQILNRLLNDVRKGDWVAPASNESIENFIKTVLGAGEEPLSGEDARMCEILWKMLEEGRGDRPKIVMQNLIGYFVYRGWLRGGSPALNRKFFGTEDNYSNIDKGNPNRSGMSNAFTNVLPLLNKIQ